MNKRTLIAVLVCLLCACMLCVSGCSLEQTVCDDNKSMNYEIPDMELAAGQSRKIPSLVADNGKNATYSLSKEGVVEVKNGTVYALADGTVTITARIECVTSTFDVVVRDRYYKISVTNDTNKGTVNGLLSEYLAGTDATLTITPKGFYTAESVTVDGVNYNVVNNKVSFPVSAAHAVTVNYTAPQYTLTINNSSSAVLTGFTAGTQDACVMNGKLSVDDPYKIPVVWVNGSPIKLTPKDNQMEYDISLTLDKDTELKVLLYMMNARPQTSDNITAVVNYANQMAGSYFMFTESKEVLPEDLAGGSTMLQLPEGEKISSSYVYRGLPYNLGKTSLEAFKLDSIGTISGTLDGATQTITRIDNSHYINKWYLTYGASCADLVLWAWAQVCGEIQMTASTEMTPQNGAWKVGVYTSEVTDKGMLIDTAADVAKNGTDVMYTAYSHLRAGDAGTRYIETDGTMTGHAILITEVHVVKNGDAIDPNASYVLYHDTYGAHGDTGKLMKIGGANYPVYSGGTYNGKMTFAKLYTEGYLPVTCKQLLAPEEEIIPEVKDSLKYVDVNNMLTGTVSATKPISHVTVTITDKSTGLAVQKATRVWNDNMTFNVALLGSQYNFEWSKNEGETYKLYELDNVINVANLSAGNYHCTLTVSLGGGYECDIRDFDFVK